VRTVIVTFHVASGAWLGARAGSRGRALALGAAAHLAGDLVPHYDFESERFELWSGVAMVGTLALRRGLFDPATLGGLACCLPDAEHILPLPKPGGRKLYPSHRYPPLHRSGPVPPMVQLAVAVALLASVLRRPA
jgi:hypothetical protein